MAWLLLQGLGLAFQMVLLSEVGRNLEAFEATLTGYCGEQHRQNGVCLGPAWNLSYSGTLTFPPQENQADFDFVIPKTVPFSFTTKSQPPTFMLGVEPLPPHADAEWQVGLRPDDSAASSVFSFRRDISLESPRRGWGSKYQVITSRDYKGEAWAGSVNLKSKYVDNALIKIFVVDSRIAHLEDIHSQPQCSFESSWQNFSEHAQGQHHRVLTLARSMITFFLVVQILLVGLVLRRFWLYVDTGKLLSRVIVLKFFFQDFPQQMCIIAYLYAWYASNGLRCQMCLFHPDHCDDQHPLHTTNLLVCVFTLLSAAANQLLIQAKMRRDYDSEDECVLCFFRFVMLSVSILPFTTAVFALSAFLLHLRSVLVYFVAGIPTILGWGTLVCVPVFACCDDEF